jgi:hypothetical protein
MPFGKLPAGFFTSSGFARLARNLLGLICFYLHLPKQGVQKMQGETMPAGGMGLADAAAKMVRNRGSDSRAKLAVSSAVL